MTTCPKCSYVRQPGDTAPEYECPSCGVVYEKYLQHHVAAEAKAAAARQAAADRARRAADAEQKRAAATALKAMEAAQRQQADMIAAAVKGALPRQRRGLGLGGALGILMVVGLLAALVMPAAPVPPRVEAPKPAPVVLTPEQQVAAAEEKQRRAKELNARELCRDRIMAEAKFPSLIDIAWLTGTGVMTAPGGVVAVSMNFTEKNAFGMEMPYTAFCRVSPEGRLAEFKIARR